MADVKLPLLLTPTQSRALSRLAKADNEHLSPLQLIYCRHFPELSTTHTDNRLLASSCWPMNSVRYNFIGRIACGANKGSPHKSWLLCTSWTNLSEPRTCLELLRQLFYYAFLLLRRRIQIYWKCLPILSSLQWAMSWRSLLNACNSIGCPTGSKNQGRISCSDIIPFGWHSI